MSVTRRTWTDDSGNLSSGTIVNNAELQRVYDDIDARWSVVTITSVGTQNNLAISEADFVIFNNATDLTVTGIGAPSSPAKPGKPMRYVCIGAGNVFFADSASATASTSTAANRIVCIAKSGLTPHAAGAGSGMLVYDATVALPRWRLVLHEQGDFITPTYAGTDWTAATGTWTVDSGDVLANRYYLRGRQLFFQISVSTTSVSATPANLAKLLFGFTAAGRNDGSITYSDNGGTNTGGQSFAPDAATAIQFLKFSGSFSVATNTTVVLSEGFVRVL